MPSNHTPGDAAIVIAAMTSTCLLLRTRLISRIITIIHDDALKSHAIGSPQFVLLMVIHTLQPATRAEIGRTHYQDRSTLTRNLRLILAEGWAEEVRDAAGGRGRPLRLTNSGTTLLFDARHAWGRAQAKTRELFGKHGAIVVSALADSIINLPPDHPARPWPTLTD